MFRARAALSVLAPAGQQNFGSWLVRQQKSRMARDFLAASAAKSYNSAAAEPFLNGSSGAYVEEMYNSWLRDPASVHASWDAYFRNNSYQAPPSLALPLKNHVPLGNASLPSVGGGGGALTGGRVDDKLIDDHLAVQAIIRSYQRESYTLAKMVDDRSDLVKLLRGDKFS